MPLCEFTKYTTAEFRANPILRARVEEEYDQYVETIKLNAIEAWNQRTSRRKDACDHISQSVESR